MSRRTNSFVDLQQCLSQIYFLAPLLETIQISLFALTVCAIWPSTPFQLHPDASLRSPTSGFMIYISFQAIFPDSYAAARWRRLPYVSQLPKSIISDSSAKQSQTTSAFLTY